MNQLSIKRWPLYVVLTLSTIVILYPVVFMILAGFTTPTEYYAAAVLPVPHELNLSNFVAVLGAGGLLESVRITSLRVIWYVLWTLVVSLLAGYVFGRLNFPGKNPLFIFFLTGLMIPQIAISLPVYVMLARWPLAGGNGLNGLGGHGFVNAWPSLFMLGLVDVFAVFLMKQNYEMLPKEYEEAALVDGASFWHLIFNVYVPMLRPVIAAVTIIVFISVWNDYFYPLLLVSGQTSLQPIALTVQKLIYNYTQQTDTTLGNYPLVFAAAALMSAPTIIVYLLLQRYFVQGMVGAGVKG